MFDANLPALREERWRFLQAYLAEWFPVPTSGGVPAGEIAAAEERLSLAIPPALREFYTRYGARPEVWRVQDRLLPPSEMRVEDDVLVFQIENQGVVFWGIRVADLHEDDPAVVVSSGQLGEPGWVVQADSMSSFAVQLAVMNTKFSAAVRQSANGQGEDEAFRAIERAYSRLPFPDSRWPTDPTSWFGRADVIIENNADTWMWVSARNRRALTEVVELVTSAGMTFEFLTER